MTDQQIANTIAPPDPLAINIQPPAMSWVSFCASMPRGKAPQIADIFRRWDEEEDIPSASNSPGMPRGKRSKENGEQRAYLAWIAGTMEEEERRYLGMLTLRTDQIVLLAIIPTIRGLYERLDRQARLLRDVNLRLTEVEQMRAAPTAATGVK